MTGRGRPTTGIKIQVRIPPDLLADIDQLAEVWLVSRSRAIRSLLKTGVERQPGYFRR